MKMRKKLSKAHNKRKFVQGAITTKAINSANFISRGGIRL